jgi:VIT1/CCC1 family predicted Fe2+/Mn2+ transporter
VTTFGDVADPVTASHPHRDEPEGPGHEHRDITGGWQRAAVFGVSDGLTTNVALILGISGAHPPAGFVRLAGLAGLVGGAFSMAAGEWLSMRAQSELLERELALERRELARAPDRERRELAALYRRRGIDRQTSDAMARQVMSDPDTALEVHAREEMGVNPASLGSPVSAAGASFATFALGALVPLLPFFFSRGNGAVLAAIALAAVAAVLVGGALARFTGRSAVSSATRQILICAAAAGVTYGIGHLVGLSGA